MYKEHSYGSGNRCEYCGGSRELIESNDWKCSLIDAPIVNGPRREVMHDFAELENYISKIPGVIDVQGVNEMDNTWTLHIDIAIGHDLSTLVIKQFEDAINGMSLKEKLPVLLPPVSIDFSDEHRRHCIITTEDEKFTPQTFLKWIQPRLPSPVSEERSWHE
jgi:hypothetical protein